MRADASRLDGDDACSVTTLDDARLRDFGTVPPGDRYRQFMADMLDRLRCGAAPSANLRDYLRAMRVIDQIYAAAGQ